MNICSLKFNSFARVALTALQILEDGMTGPRTTHDRRYVQKQASERICTVPLLCWLRVVHHHQFDRSAAHRAGDRRSAASILGHAPTPVHS